MDRFAAAVAVSPTCEIHAVYGLRSLIDFGQ
jgi:hypothetical protein